jgi:mannose/fructose/N-acetylgalactosamine-specific phosphotransferase system component IID
MNTPNGHSASSIMKGVNARVFLRSFFLETLWNYEKMQNIGFVFCILPALSRLFPDVSQRDAAVRRSLEPLNTHPSMGPLLAGLTARLEHDLDAATVLTYRKRLMSTLAAHGDHIFWGHIKPLAAIFGVILTLFFYGSVAGSLALLIIYNVPNLFARSRGFHKGWKDWLKVLQILHSQAVERALVVAKLVLAASLGIGAGLVFLSALKVGQLGAGELGPWIHGTLLIIGGGSGFLLLKRQVPLAVVVYVIPMALLLAFILLETRGWFS